MPRLKGTGKGQTERFNIRLDESAAHFYRTKANEHGVSISEYLRQTLVQGVIAENVHEIEQRLRRLIDSAHATSTSLPDEVLLSILMSEYMLTAIVQSRDTQQLYEAQDKAKAKLAQIKEKIHGES